MRTVCVSYLTVQFHVVRVEVDLWCESVPVCVAPEDGLLPARRDCTGHVGNSRPLWLQGGSHRGHLRSWARVLLPSVFRANSQCVSLDLQWSHLPLVPSAAPLHFLRNHVVTPGLLSADRLPVSGVLFTIPLQSPFAMKVHSHRCREWA